jgi:TonB family protein
MYFDFDVDVPVRIARRATPIHPGDEDSRGEVLIQVAVDSMGKPDLRTLKAIRTPSDRATASMAQAIRLWRFEPARKAGRPVRQLVQITFVFQ